MKKVSIAIMAHPERLEQASLLAERLTCPLLLDTDEIGEVANGQRAWLATRDTPALFSLVLQDDAVLVDDFENQVEIALNNIPLERFAPGAISLYTGTGRPHAELVSSVVRRCDKQQQAWWQAPALFWGVAVAVRQPHAGKMLDASSSVPYDRQISQYWQVRNQHAVYLHPSLVDHADGETLIEHPWGSPAGIERHAHRHGVPASYAYKPIRL